MKKCIEENNMKFKLCEDCGVNYIETYKKCPNCGSVKVIDR